MGLLSPQIFLNPCSPLQGPPGVPLDLPTTPPVILFFFGFLGLSVGEPRGIGVRSRWLVSKGVLFGDGTDMTSKR